jgi:hypothetical protein
MPIIFKLVGNVKLRGLQIKYDIIGEINLSTIVSIFKTYGIQSESFEYIQFITESETLKNDSKFFDISNDYDQIIFVFTAQKKINEQLINIFSENIKDEIITTTHLPLVKTVFNNDDTDINNDTCDVELNKPIYDKVEEENPAELSQDIINSCNAKTIKLFENKNFQHLVKIYYTDPDIIKTFINFVSHGDIVKITIPKIDEEKDYSDEINLLKSIGVSENDEVIIQVLKRFNGHINLSFRTLLRNKAINYEEQF